MMKDEEKRQAGESSTTATTTTTINKLPTEGDSQRGGGGATEATSIDDKGGSGNLPASPTPSSDFDTSGLFVEFQLVDSGRFENKREYLLKRDDDPVAVPLLLHPGLGEGSPLRMDKYVCGFNNKAQPEPECHKALEPGQAASISRRADSASGELTFNTLEVDALFLRVNWSRADDVPNTTGWSYSTLFTNADESRKPDEQESDFIRTWGQHSFIDPINGLSLDLGTEEPFESVPPNARAALAAAALAIENASPSPTRTAATPTANPSTDPRGGASETSDATPTPTPSSGGLSHGAIIGIGVAAGVIGLLAIGLLVWFFCLRNRRRHGTKDHGPYAAPDHQASEYMVNKETTGAHVTESPHSPYSDDGSLAHPQGQGSSLAQVQQQQQTNQYSDAPPIATPVPRSAAQQAGDRPGSGSGTRSGTPGGGHNVSHLIEEGMTEADIRRLEEEERALDDAIERAGHGRR